MANWYRRIIFPRLIKSAMSSQDREKVRQEVVKHATGEVLEIGVGPGYNIPFYQNISKLYALEPANELIKQAGSRAAEAPFQVEFLETMAERIPLLDNCIDTVVSTWTLCSVRDPAKVLQEIFRVLKPQGKFVFSDHGASPRAGVLLAQRAYTSVSKYFTGNCHLTRDIEKLVKEAGFSIQDMTQANEERRLLVYNYQGVAVKP